VEEVQWGTKDLYVSTALGFDHQLSISLTSRSDISRKSTRSKTTTSTPSSQAATSSSCC
jgi:hypothetical protein